MPNPSRWGKATHAVTIPVPEWVFAAAEELRRAEDWRTTSMTFLELVVEALAARGVADPDHKVPRKQVTAKPRRTR